MIANQTGTLENYCTKTVLNVDKLEKKIKRDCGQDECVGGTGERNQKLWLSVSDRLDKYAHHLQFAFSTCVIFMVKFFD